MDYLAERAISKKTVSRFGLRPDGDRIGFPVHDADGTEVYVRRHMPNPPPGVDKMLNGGGGKGRPTRLYPLCVLDAAAVDAWVIVGGGELDVLAAIDTGLIAVCGTNGERAVPRGDLCEPFRERRVAIALDNDEPGRKASQKWAKALEPLASELRVMTLPESSDLNDWFTSGKTASELLALIEATPAYGTRRTSTELLALALQRADDGEGRNNTGFWLACQLRDERYSKAESWTTVRTYQQAVEDEGNEPYREDEARESLDSAWTEEPRKPTPASKRNGSPGLEDGPLSEYVAERLQGRYVYVSERKNWLHNAGPVWEPSSQTAVIEAVRDELKAVFDSELARSTNVGHISQLLRRGKMENVASLLKGILEVPYSEFDTHPDHLNTPSGIVDLKTGAVEPHSDAYKFTKITKAPYEARATSRRWSKALNALPKELHEHIQILFGQAVTGHPPDHDKVTFLQGGGANGKSSLLDGIQLALGTFAGPVPEKVMVGRPGDGTPTEMMELRGKRLVVMEEMPQGAPLGTKRLKDVAGTATINARPLYGEVVTWQATHTMFVTSNHRPHVTETDHGTWRRLQMVAFPYRFVSGSAELKPGERRGDPELRHHFRTVPDEAVLAWLVEGARRWYALGMRTPEAPEAIVKATDAWRNLTDDVMQFVQERFVFDPEGAVLAGDVWEAFDAWAKTHNKRGWSQNTYADRFEEHPLLREHGVHHVRQRADSLVVSLPPYLVGPGPTLRDPHREAKVTGKQRLWRGMRWRERP